MCHMRDGTAFWQKCARYNISPGSSLITDAVFRRSLLKIMVNFVQCAAPGCIRSAFSARLSSAGCFLCGTSDCYLFPSMPWVCVYVISYILIYRIINGKPPNVKCRYLHSTHATHILPKMSVLKKHLYFLCVLCIIECVAAVSYFTAVADASHSKSAKSAATTASYGIFSSENAYPCTVTHSCHT